jgi:uncharacterized protein YdhG (YjbR/CyaY superfamily)
VVAAEAPKNAGSIDQYIAGFPADVRERLQAIRAMVHEVAPEATEGISYGMPAFKQGGGLVYFAAFKHHIGLYGASAAADAFKDRIGNNKTTKGSIQFPSDRPLPMDLIREILEFRVQESFQRREARKSARVRKKVLD